MSITDTTNKPLNRRSVIKAGAGLAAIAVASPAIVRNARSSSGELSLLNWSDEFPGDVIPNFEKATGIKVKTTPFSQNEEQINKLQASGGDGYDLVQPTRDRAPQFKELDVLASYDTGKLKNFANLQPAFLDSSASIWTWDGKLYHLPHLWGTEAISWRTDLWKGDPAKLSYGDLWADDVKGHVQGRPHSLLAGIGLWLDATGKLPTNRLLDAYKDEDSFKKIYDEIPQGGAGEEVLDQAVLGLGRQHQVGPARERRDHRPDLGWSGDQPQEGGQARQLSGARRRCDHLG
ncbi:extracellular solute-binding protein [Aestuariivirga sp.]|uniref:extracellular solute-binding protein n=1 Tax=Aestuariivirga sp. TaxID=2650926 RepID=UPI0039E3AA62